MNRLYVKRILLQGRLNTISLLKHFLLLFLDILHHKQNLQIIYIEFL